MNKIILLGIGGFFSFSFSSVLAHETTMFSDDNFENIYLGMKAGLSSIESSCDAPYSDCDISNTAYGIFAGYKFSPRVSLELGMTDFQDYIATYEGEEFISNITGYDTSLRLSTPIFEKMSGFVRLGATYVFVDRKVGLNYVYNTGWTPSLGAGLEYDLTSYLSVRSEYQLITDIYGSKGHFASLGLSYHFGASDNEPSKVKPTVPIAVHDNTMPVELIVSKNAKDIVSNDFKDEVDLAIDDSHKKDEVSLTIDDSHQVLQSQLGSVLFNTNTSTLSSEAQLSLDQLVLSLEKYPQVKVWLAGHTDSLGSDQYNQKLSLRRANSVGDYLVKKGINVSKIFITGQGEKQPIASNATPEGRAKNRRVVITLGFNMAN